MLASSKGNKEIVEILLKNKADVNETTDDDCTALKIAAYNGHTEIIALLLKYNANVNIRDKDGITPLIAGFIFSLTN